MLLRRRQEARSEETFPLGQLERLLLQIVSYLSPPSLPSPRSLANPPLAQLNSTRVLQPYYEATEPDFLHYRNTAKQILQKEDELAEIVQLVGKSSLGEADKVTLDVARLIKEDFLQQNGISVYDRYCPFYKTVRYIPLPLPPSPSSRALADPGSRLRLEQTAMLKCLVAYYEAAVKTVENNPITWAKVREATSDVWFRLTQMKFEDPATGQGGFCFLRSFLLSIVLNRKLTPLLIVVLSNRGHHRGSRRAVQRHWHAVPGGSSSLLLLHLTLHALTPHLPSEYHRVGRSRGGGGATKAQREQRERIL